jgi:hypothetical protein
MLKIKLPDVASIVFTLFPSHMRNPSICHSLTPGNFDILAGLLPEAI